MNTTAPTRYDDINIDDKKSIPPGLIIIEGKFLMMTARTAKIPYGIAYKRTYGDRKSTSRMETVGIIISAVDEKKFRETYANRGSSKRKKQLIKNP